MTLMDHVWELIDTTLYVTHCAAVVLIGVSATACPLLLWRIAGEVAALRAAPPAACRCDCRDHDGPGPVLPRVLPRLRRIGEEAAE